MKNGKNIIFVHGIFDTGHVFANFSNLMRDHGYKTFSIDLYPNYGIAGIEELAAQLDSFADKKIPREEKFSLVGFSMGGIVSRHYLQNLGGTDRVDKFIAISSPHFGTALSYLLPLKGNLQMRPGSKYLQELNKNIDSLSSVSPVSFWTKYDQMIIPQNSAIMGIGESIQMPIFPHGRMAKAKLVSHALLDCIDEIKRDRPTKSSRKESHQDQVYPNTITPITLSRNAGDDAMKELFSLGSLVKEGLSILKSQNTEIQVSKMEIMFLKRHVDSFKFKVNNEDGFVKLSEWWTCWSVKWYSVNDGRQVALVDRVSENEARSYFDKLRKEIDLGSPQVVVD